MAQERSQPMRSAKTQLTAHLLERGYRNFDVLGPFTSRNDSRQYVVTIYAGDNSALHRLRGTFEELPEQIEALPQG